MAEQSKVSDVMTRDPKRVRDTDTAKRAAEVMANSGVGIVPVCDPSDHVLGVLTDRDIVIEVVGRDRAPNDTYAGSLIGDNPVTIASEAPLSEAHELMMSHQIRRLPVTDGGVLVGIVAMADLAVNVPQQRAGELARALSFD